jgi:hypothetical protein
MLRASSYRSTFEITISGALNPRRVLLCLGEANDSEGADEMTLIPRFDKGPAISVRTRRLLPGDRRNMDDFVPDLFSLLLEHVDHSLQASELGIGSGIVNKSQHQGDLLASDTAFEIGFPKWLRNCCPKIPEAFALR